MRDVLDKLDAWRKANEELTIATVVNTWGSAPRPIGSKMITTRSGGIAGSVSAGCVEGAVIEEGLRVLDTNQPRLLTFGVADENAWEVGLACGGTIQVFVEPSFALDDIYDSFKNTIEAHQPFVVVTVLHGSPEQMNRKLLVLSDGRTEGNLDFGGQTKHVLEIALARLENERGGVVDLPDSTSLFVEVYPLPPRLIVIGAVHLAETLVSVANTIGFDTIVIDPRKAFATQERFPHAKSLVVKWPQDALPQLNLNRSSFVVILTHDPKLDDPTLQMALTSNAGYIGALGSRRTNQKRVERLRQAGLSEDQIKRLHAPIGLDIGGRTNGEIAISIMAEIIQVRNQLLKQ